MARSRTDRGRSSGKAGSVDERAMRTRNKLGSAIIALGKQQPIDSISIGALCAAANISRSTFYAHFGSLRGYLTMSFANMLEQGAIRSAAELDVDSQPLPVSAILAHVGQSGSYGLAIMSSKHFPAMIVAGEDRLKRVASVNLKRIIPGMAEPDRLSLATFIAGGFMAMLRRWMAGESREPACQLRANFERLCYGLVSSYDSAA